MKHSRRRRRPGSGGALVNVDDAIGQDDGVERAGNEAHQRTQGSLRSSAPWGNIGIVNAPFRVKTVGNRRVNGGDVWEAVRQLMDTAERIRGSRALVPRGLHRFETFEEAHEWMMEKIASTHASHGRKILRKSARR